MNFRNAFTFAFALFFLPAAARAAQDPDKEEIMVRSK
jgi:hypothetical protein